MGNIESGGQCRRHERCGARKGPNERTTTSLSRLGPTTAEDIKTPSRSLTMHRRWECASGKAAACLKVGVCAAADRRSAAMQGRSPPLAPAINSKAEISGGAAGVVNESSLSPIVQRPFAISARIRSGLLHALPERIEGDIWTRNKHFYLGTAIVETVELTTYTVNSLL